MFLSHEQTQLLSALFGGLEDPESVRRIVETIAGRTSIRTQTLMVWPRERLFEFIKKHGERAISDRLFQLIFKVYFNEHEIELFSKLFESLNIELESSDDLVIPNLDRPLKLKAADASVRHLLSHCPERSVQRVVEYLRLRDENWEPLGPALHSAQQLKRKDDAPPVTKSPTQVSEDFTTIDRVLIDQIVATSSHAESALDEDEIDDLIQTLVALNPKRKRSYFVLGYADVLVSDRTLDFERQEFDDERRSWYLTGALLGFLRQRRENELVALLQARGDDFRRAVDAKGPGLVLAKNLIPDLVRLGRIGEAVKLVTAHCKHGGLRVAKPALEEVVRLLRINSAPDAMALVRPLWDAYGDVSAEETAALTRFRRDLARRLAQCLQAHGDFSKAEELLAKFAGSGSEEDQARILADRGLVAARVKSVFELVLPSEPAERRLRTEALRTGEEYFAKSLSSGVVVSSMYALGQLKFLEWRLEGERDASKRDEAIRLLQSTITQMRLTEAAAAYERSGILGQSLFMLTVLTLHRLSPTDINAAMELWRQITIEAGSFPDEDLRLLLEVAGMTTDTRAISFAESIWHHRRGEALDLVLNTGLIERSSMLRRELHEYVRAEGIPHAVQRRILVQLIPVLLRLHEEREAEAALDLLETIAEGDESLGEISQFLSHPSNYEPAWTEVEALWAIVRLTRKAGEDEHATKYLETLFYRVRDQDVDVAEGIVDLMSAWHYDADVIRRLQASLPTRTVVSGRLDSEGRLRHGESAKVTFVGGNEAQERYDGSIRDFLASEYPGITISFHHTGWTSNWGQQLSALVKECNHSDAVVIMTMMRTMLGRRLREALQKPWIPCVARGETGVRRSIVRAACVAVSLRMRAAKH